MIYSAHLFAQILYRCIRLIYVTLSHAVLSQMVQYLLSYIKFTTLAVKNVCFEKFSHGYCVTRNPHRQNPYPNARVQVSWGRGTGSPGKPQGYPCQSLGLLALNRSRASSTISLPVVLQPFLSIVPI
jgi:hypothetical protein